MVDTQEGHKPDTVLQHARMYGFYRRKDIGLLRLFYPRELHVVFRAINKMEAQSAGIDREEFERRVSRNYVESGLTGTARISWFAALLEFTPAEATTIRLRFS